MAKKSKVVANERRKQTVARHAERRFGKVGLSRINLRRLAHAGELPGVTKSSW